MLNRRISLSIIRIEMTHQSVRRDLLLSFYSTSETPMKPHQNKPPLLLSILCAFALIACLNPTVVASESKSQGHIAKDTAWETPYHIIDSGVEGPTVVLTGGIHGNEPAGFRAAEQIRHWPIIKGRLVVVPKVNIPGLQANTRFMPNVSRELRDLNRDFSVNSAKGITTKGVLATELWKFVKNQEPDWVIDLHEGFEFHNSHRPSKGKKRSVGSTIIYRESESLNPMIERALLAVNDHVSDPNNVFVPLKRGPVSGSLANASIVNLGAKSMILETTYKDQPISLRTRQHRAMANSLLNDIGLIDHDCSHLVSPGTLSETIQVGLFDGPGTGSSGKTNIPRIVDQANNIDIHFLGVEDIHPDVLSQFDLLIFPGGSGSKQANALGDERREFVRHFVKDRGGYVGVCAGAYLCSAHYSWSLNLVDSHVFTGSREIEGIGRKQMWYRGETTRIEIELSEAGQQIFVDVPPKFDVNYHNGPIISPKQSSEIEDYTPLAWFRSEQVRYPPQQGTMINTPAIVSGRFGEGRIISISPHPEADQKLESIIVDSIRWVALHPSNVAD